MLRTTAPPRPDERLAPSASRPKGPARRRLVGVFLLYLFTLWALATLVFIIPRALDGDPLAGYANQAGVVPPQLRAYYNGYYGLDRPLIDQYGRYLNELAHGNLGKSISDQVPVSRLLVESLPWTLLLVGTSILVSSVVSFWVALDAAWRRGSGGDWVMLATHIFLHSFPDFVLALFVLVGFGILLRAFPTTGGSTPFSGSASALFKFRDVADHLVLPATALSLGLMGSNFLLVRNITIGVLGQDYMVLARAKGLPERLLKRRHAGRNVFPPFLNLVGLHVGAAVGGAIFIETVFGYPGMGRLIVASVNNLDYPVIEACFLALAAFVLTANLIVDLVTAYLDPRTHSV